MTYCKHCAASVHNARECEACAVDMLYPGSPNTSVLVQPLRDDRERTYWRESQEGRMLLRIDPDW